MLTFLREEDGQGLVEYALIIAVIAIAVIVAMIFLRGQLQNIFSNIGNNLPKDATTTVVIREDPASAGSSFFPALKRYPARRSGRRRATRSQASRSSRQASSPTSVRATMR